MDLRTPEEMCRAIRKMHLRGAGLIGAAAPERSDTSRSDDGPPFSTATF
jgi:methylthioribose-1-phosphate isomerase